MEIAGTATEERQVVVVVIPKVLLLLLFEVLSVALWADLSLILHCLSDAAVMLHIQDTSGCPPGCCVLNPMLSGVSLLTSNKSKESSSP